MRARRLLPLIFVVACGPTDPGGGDSDDAGGVNAAADAHSWPNEFADARTPTGAGCTAMDIVFVIDNSGSMADEQQNLTQHFADFIDVLDGFETSDGQPLDYRVAVTTTGVTKNWTSAGIPGSQSGDDGAFRADCGTAQPWLERGDPDVVGTFECMASVGISGPLYEMPLEALSLALTDRVSDGTNAGFHRDEALLAVIIITDEDDCSRRDNGFALAFGQDPCAGAEPEANYLSELDGVAGGRDRWAMAVIAGMGPGVCVSSLGSALPAERLMHFADAAGDNAVVSSLCDGDLSTPLADALAAFDAACGSFPDVD